MSVESEPFVIDRLQKFIIDEIYKLAGGTVPGPSKAATEFRALVKPEELSI